MLDPDEAKQLATDQTSRDIAKLYQLYQQRLQAEQALDFDDLLVLTYYMLLEYPQVAAHYQQQFQQVLIDEYQDTNYVQYLLGKLLAAPQQNLFVVGDFSQSIYAWRGADYRNLQRLSQDFSDLTEYRLERNYRSPQHILDAATQVIKQNQSHPILELWTDKPDQIQQKIEVYELESGELEAVKVSQIISEQLRNNLTEVAILYRTNAQSRLFEEALINRQIPYHIVGGTKFYERQEIKDLLAYLRLAVNELDSPSLNRALKLGKRRFKKFQSWLQQVEQTVLDNPLTALQGILEATAYQDRFDAKNPEDQSRLDNIQELLNVAGQFPQSLQFLENVALIQDDYLLDQAQVQPNPGVTLMSLHSAKGLEFATVFMVGLEEGLLPHARSLLEIASLEEERRLCYVGITRAKERLILTCARYRYNYGNQAEDSSLPFPRLSRSSRIKRSQAHSKRRLIIDDEQLDALLHDELDVQDFLNQ